MAIKPGIYAASISIFNEDLLLDVSNTISHAEYLVRAGCHGVAIFGSTGMAQLISSSEKKKLIEEINGSEFKDNFLIGTGSNSFNENIQLMKHCLSNGINRFLMMPPAYYKYEDEGAYSFFSNVIQRVPECEIILYNFEKLSGYKFSIELVEKLVKDYPKQILGVKDSSYNLYDKIKIPNFLIFPGSEKKLLQGLELGCSGIITATCNVTATLARKVYDDFINKKKQTFNEKLCLIRNEFDKYNLISGLHSFLAHENKKYKIVLPPLSLLPKQHSEELINKLKELKFFPEKT
jgi:4-hydroxy-tetrahydrodipicolinate synthase